MYMHRDSRDVKTWPIGHLSKHVRLVTRCDYATEEVREKLLRALSVLSL